MKKRKWISEMEGRSLGRVYRDVNVGHMEKAKSLSSTASWWSVARTSVLLASLALWTHPALAQLRTYQYEYQETVDEATKISALSSDLFGDSVSYIDGGVEFSVSDVEVKTNSIIPVGFGRKIRPARSPEGNSLRGSVDQTKDLLGKYWVPDLPVISGIYQTGSYFVTGTSPRCSSGKLSPLPISMWPHNGPYYIWTFNFWNGVSINIPRKGEETVDRLAAATVVPADGATYKYTTKSNWMISCLGTLKNGAGEGFSATLPDGTKYFFDWIATQEQKRLFLFNMTEPQRSETVYRTRVMIFATKAVDKFGNWVEYNYDAQNPTRITSITSSDGASIGFQYDGYGKLSTVSTAGRTWTYSYVPHPYDTSPGARVLSGVQLPDGSSWGYEYKNDMIGYSTDAVKFAIDGNDCTFNPGTMTSASPSDPAKEGELKIKHPSGASGVFKFRGIVHGKNNVTAGSCGWGDSAGWVLSGRPKAYPLSSLVSKSISGPGVPTQTWSLSYSPSWSYESQCASGCPSTSTTTVSDSAGKVERYVFGNDFKANDGRLITKTISSQSVVLSRVDYQYLDDLSGQPFPEYFVIPEGLNETLENQLPKRNSPVRRTTIAQDGVVFSSAVNAFDSFVRPISVTKSSAPSP